MAMGVESSRVERTILAFRSPPLPPPQAAIDRSNTIPYTIITHPQIQISHDPEPPARASIPPRPAYVQRSCKSPGRSWPMCAYMHCTRRVSPENLQAGSGDESRRRRINGQGGLVCLMGRKTRDT
ncbi:predicted protein [Plenodomus lingam JN3]|uniref:Predicted protein n=1 Tax=Leptosphaeria maculans (strain JN3 / isolate v23.1.3 / race Av1-4-5-6-7-8) TaxID=985895 RepID=E5A9J6_LEPMJ|nr:predicted protein [Plenodomus lingam JN3]CBY00337.1 predicted protein [Plenodomus lingam JN3]